MNHLLRHLLAALLCAVILLSAAPATAAPRSQAAAQGAAPVPGAAQVGAATQRPTEVRRVKINLFIISVRNVDSSSGSYEVDMYLDLYWQDPALENTTLANVDEATLWDPLIEFANASSTNIVYQFFLNSTEASTNLRSSYRIIGTYDGRFDLHKFPFDEQDLYLTIESADFDSNELVFEFLSPDTAPLEALTNIDKPLVQSIPIGKHIASDLDLGEWTLNAAQVSQGMRMLEYDKSTWSSFTLSLAVARRSEIYVWKILAIVILMMALSWSVLWIDVAEIRFRLLALFTLLLAMVLLDLATLPLRPRVAYLTLVDLYFMAAYGLLTGIAVVVFLTYYLSNAPLRVHLSPAAAAQGISPQALAQADREALTARVNRIALFGYPVLLVLTNVVLLWYGLS